MHINQDLKVILNEEDYLKIHEYWSEEVLEVLTLSIGWQELLKGLIHQKETAFFFEDSLFFL